MTTLSCSGKSSAILLGRRLLAHAATELALDAQELLEQGGRCGSGTSARKSSIRGRCPFFQARSNRSAAASIQLQSAVRISFMEDSGAADEEGQSVAPASHGVTSSGL